MLRPACGASTPAQETHKFESRYLDKLLGPLPEAAKIYEERSPILALDKFAAPVAFFQASRALSSCQARPQQLALSSDTCPA